METRWKRLRFERGWSQRDVLRRMEAVARRQGVPFPSEESAKKAISRWENGHSKPTSFYYGLLAEVFDLPPDDGPSPVAAPKPGTVTAELVALRVEVARLSELVSHLAAVA
ncbi:DNA-binding transcriptional regulator, XRE-family HTH domain [Micromonospora matsumotoense]|uniref:DNA-binding transcriptional regulator, XRE-family HTH domain n=1 Tax=Micromonospora matsumotoense TaxID=121616 RepID=A0A1C4ZVU7_9ACTN|nr:helix-turn-helix transcriptional regulator [Micromonospora matsumotoense]SCF37082.1 DNA-binding transcriptional regulator, XRE-family HTH domain [Micromonospora matsumotoense]